MLIGRENSVSTLAVRLSEMHVECREPCCPQEQSTKNAAENNPILAMSVSIC
jgi:hypothetical protein